MGQASRVIILESSQIKDEFNLSPIRLSNSIALGDSYEPNLTEILIQQSDSLMILTGVSIGLGVVANMCGMNMNH